VHMKMKIPTQLTRITISKVKNNKNRIATTETIGLLYNYKVVSTQVMELKV